MAAPVVTGGRCPGAGGAELGTGINSAAPALIGVPGAYFCSDPDTRAAVRACTRISWPCAYFFPSTESVGGAAVSRRSISTCCTNPPASPSGSSPQSCICAPRYDAAIHSSRVPLPRPFRASPARNCMWLRTETSVMVEGGAAAPWGGGWTAQPVARTRHGRTRRCDFTPGILCGKCKHGRGSRRSPPSTLRGQRLDVAEYRPQAARTSSRVSHQIRNVMTCNAGSEKTGNPSGPPPRPSQRVRPCAEVPASRPSHHGHVGCGEKNSTPSDTSVIRPAASMVVNRRRMGSLLRRTPYRYHRGCS